MPRYTEVPRLEINGCKKDNRLFSKQQQNQAPHQNNSHNALSMGKNLRKAIEQGIICGYKAEQFSNSFTLPI